MIELHMYYSDNIFAQLDTDYVYTPYGLVRTAGAITQPIQWSSEFADLETALIYYNYRYYNPLDGRWTRRDPIGIEGGVNLYSLLLNSPVDSVDYVGWKEISECQTLSYNKNASAPAWLLNVGRSFGIHGIKGSISISGKICKLCCNRNKKGKKISISGNYNATVEIGTPALKGLGAKFRLGWYGKTTAGGSIGIDYSSCTGDIRPSLNASVSIELGLIMQISDKKEKYIGAKLQGGAGLTFTPQIDSFSDKGFDLSVYVNFYATMSLGFYLGLFSYSFESRYESDHTLLYSIPVHF